MSRQSLITDLAQQQLTDLLWRRLRLQEPIDPPLERRFRIEPPEELFINALQRSEHPRSYKTKLLQAIRDNLRRVIRLTAGGKLDATDNEQIASLAFLANAIEAVELAEDFYRAALYADAADGINEQTRFHLLRTLAGLQTDHRLIPYWRQLWRSHQSTIRAIAVYGLSRIDPKGVLELLPELLEDQEIDLPPIVWHLVTDGPGATALGRAARQLPRPAQNQVREALMVAGADETVLRAFDLQVDNAITGFEFPVPAARDPAAARHRPHWYADELAQVA